MAGLTPDDLRELGVGSIGHRRKLLDAIALLNGAVGAAGPASPARIEDPVTSVATAEAERRHLTVMFVDLLDSTALSARLDPEDMGRVIRAYQNAVAGEILRVEGHVAKFMGDGVMAYFGWPRAHEDEPERAVRAGLSVVEAVARLEGGGAPLSCRIGVATWLVVVGELLGDGAAHERAVAAETPNLAARLQGVAEPGEVVVSEATRALIAGRFEMTPLAPQSLKGIEELVGAFRVAGERARESRFDALTDGAAPPIVGRDQELALLLERWETARRGEGQAVMLAGEAGIGKSRIVRALEDALQGTPHTRLLFQCSPFHADSAFWPIIGQFSRAAGFAADDGTDARLDKLEALAGAEDAPLLAALLGLDGAARYGPIDLAPAAQRAQTLRALTRQVLRLAEARPVAFLMEDVHWIDPTTLELLELTMDAVATAPVLMVLTSRPDGQPPLAAHPHVTRLALNRLGRAGVDAPEWPAVRYGGWVGYYVGADLPEAERLAREVLADRRKADPHAFLGVANRMLATTLTMAGRFRESLPHLEECVAFYDPTRDADHGRRYGTDSGASAHVYSALARWVLGEVEASREHQRKGLEIAARPDHPALSLAYTTGHVAFAAVTAGEADALDAANRVIDQSSRDGIEIWRVFGLIARCAARAAAGDPEGALADAEEGRAGLRKAGSRLFLGILLRAEARAHIALGAREAAARSIAEMEAIVAETGQRWDEADLRCVEAELALAHGDVATAEARYRAAIEPARVQMALSWERRAAIPLARLLAARGAAAEARAMLAAIQDRFLDGSDTPDQRAAAALLAELDAP